MKIDVPSTTMIRRKMKDRLHAFHGSFDHGLVQQIAADKLNLPGIDVSLNTLQPSAAQVIDHTNRCSLLDESIHQSRADKRSSPCYQYGAVFPVHFRCSSWA